MCKAIQLQETQIQRYHIQLQETLKFSDITYNCKKHSNSAIITYNCKKHSNSAISHTTARNTQIQRYHSFVLRLEKSCACISIESNPPLIKSPPHTQPPPPPPPPPPLSLSFDQVALTHTLSCQVLSSFSTRRLSSDRENGRKYTISLIRPRNSSLLKWHYKENKAL